MLVNVTCKFYSYDKLKLIVEGKQWNTITPFSSLNTVPLLFCVNWSLMLNVCVKLNYVKYDRIATWGILSRGELLGKKSVFLIKLTYGDVEFQIFLLEGPPNPALWGRYGREGMEGSYLARRQIIQAAASLLCIRFLCCNAEILNWW